jgi:hypothetical protein
MTYYIVMFEDNKNDLWDENQLGESSFGMFYPGRGMEALKNIIEKHPIHLKDVEIINERNDKFTVVEFLELIKDMKIYEVND